MQNETQIFHSLFTFKISLQSSNPFLVCVDFAVCTVYINRYLCSVSVNLKLIKSVNAQRYVEHLAEIRGKGWKSVNLDGGLMLLT